MKKRYFNSELEQRVYKFVAAWDPTKPCYYRDIAKGMNIQLDEVKETVHTLEEKGYLYPDLV